MADNNSVGKIILSGLFGAVAAAAISGVFNLRIEQQKFEANSQLERQKYYFTLITRALEDDNPDDRAARLKFLLSLGIIEDQQLSNRLTEQANDPKTLPQFPPDHPLPDATEWQVVIGDYKDEKEQQTRKDAAAKAGVPEGEPFGNPAYKHLRFRFPTREAAKAAADKLKKANVSHEPDVLRYRPRP
jgi:hypothetical protein